MRKRLLELKNAALARLSPPASPTPAPARGSTGGAGTAAAVAAAAPSPSASVPVLQSGGPAPLLSPLGIVPGAGNVPPRRDDNDDVSGPADQSGSTVPHTPRNPGQYVLPTEGFEAEGGSSGGAAAVSHTPASALRSEPTLSLNDAAAVATAVPDVAAPGSPASSCAPTPGATLLLGRGRRVRFPRDTAPGVLAGASYHTSHDHIRLLWIFRMWKGRRSGFGGPKVWQRSALPHPCTAGPHFSPTALQRSHGCCDAAASCSTQACTTTRMRCCCALTTALQACWPPTACSPNELQPWRVCVKDCIYEACCNNNNRIVTMFASTDM